jgi:hypothetical protein
VRKLKREKFEGKFFCRWIMCRVYVRCLLVFEVLFSFTFINGSSQKNSLHCLLSTKNKNKLWQKKLN